MLRQGLQAGGLQSVWEQRGGEMRAGCELLRGCGVLLGDMHAGELQDGWDV